jgi:hypothetical protein
MPDRFSELNYPYRENYPPLVLLCCGGRDFNDVRLVWNTLDFIYRQRHIALIVHGAASGADTLAARWAENAGVGVKPYTADWSTYGKSAGMLRNGQMLRENDVDCVIAFPGGAGTADMVSQARAAGVPVFQPTGAETVRQWP